jgi:hypothetical protein
MMLDLLFHQRLFDHYHHYQQLRYIEHQVLLPMQHFHAVHLHHLSQQEMVIHDQHHHLLEQALE